MPRLAITQPLPQDLRNWSFKGMQCEGWDFAGRDIRGCDFSNAKLNGANFTRVIAGRSQKQIIISLLIVGAVVGTGTGTGALLNAIGVFGKEQLFVGLALGVAAIMFFSFSFVSFALTIQEFKNATGTNFKGANLKGVNFSYATLNNCNFYDVPISHINWSHIEGTRSTINFTHTRMQLLISRKGTNGVYSDLDLSDRHLVDVDLMRANLSGADLTRSNLEHAKLNFANLTNVKAGGTNFRHANLTGACNQQLRRKRTEYETATF